MVHRPLGRTGLSVTPIGYGAFKIGRNEGIKYPRSYDLPSDESASQLLNAVLDMGINFIDTAPAYGLSEQRIGAAISHRREEFVLSTKVGETFDAGRSIYDFSTKAVRASLERSLRNLRTDVIDLVFVHSDGRDLIVLNETDVVSTLKDFKKRGLIRAIGFSGKTVEGARQSLSWADAIMVEYHPQDQSHASVIHEAAGAGIGVIIKKPLASGRIPPQQAIPFLLGNPAISSIIIGGLDADHLRANVALAGGR